MPQTINAPMVIADNIDGEVIILNMESGKYYSTQGSGAAIELAAPEISSHTDMQGLLLLDPIHEVEDMGWPHKPSEQSS